MDTVKEHMEVPIYNDVGFDPGAMERASELANSERRGTIEGMRKKQKERQADCEKEMSKANEQGRQIAEHRKQVEQQARAKQREAVRAHEKHRAEYRNDLHKKRDKDAQDYDKIMQDKKEQMKEDQIVKLDALQRQTLEYEAQLRQKTELARVRAETDGRIHSERVNRDLRLKMMRENFKERRQTILESITLAGSTLGAGFSDFLSDYDRQTAAVFGLSMVALGIYTAKVSTSVAGRYIENRLGKPSLVRETSRSGLSSLLSLPKNLLSGSKDSGDVLEGVILEADLERRLRAVAVSTKNTKLNQAPFRHMLLYGPPGTGKTLFAKSLAKHSGLDYAIMTGGDVAPLGRDGVTEIHKVFEWAQASNKGLLLLIDEADAFLRRRSTEVISEDMRNALNAFLYRTGDASDKFMVVFASNQPEQLDWAINDRIDEMVNFHLPNEMERLRMIVHYMDKLLEEKTSATPITITGIDEALVRTVAERTDGFSGREISKLTVAWQAAAYGTSPPTLTSALMEETLEAHLSQKVVKLKWTEAESVAHNAAVVS
uniref:AAA+ ATPase domain-containing protein n=1 Tax=Octactis speculum TaxID=3111310 RepID=A0A7S2BQU8_9STRA|mmetsp:Transcript_25870/g.35604  ORF Transcript_25870/g.35604 Transcript_25870/m.35604 type:complete len:545 (+) Transcript_25870:75-1709(+)